MEEKATLIIRYLDGTLDKEQADRLMQLMREDPALRREVLDMEDIAVSVGESKMTPWEKERRFADLMRAIGGRRKYVRHQIHKFLAVAAVFVAAVGVGMTVAVLKTSHLPPQPLTLMVEPGNMSALHLPDGSVVTLKSSSVLRYDAASFLQKDRKVMLDGEAFFEVAQDRKHPFIVETAMQTVHVHGTAFNLQAYRDDRANTLVLLSGEVEVELMDEAGKRIHSLGMKPGERCVYDRMSGETQITQLGGGEMNQQWNGNVFYFQNYSLRQIADRLEHYYKVKIDLDEMTGTLSGYSGAVSLSQGVENILNTLNYDRSFSITPMDKDYYLLTKNE